MCSRTSSLEFESEVQDRYRSAIKQEGEENGSLPMSITAGIFELQILSHQPPLEDGQEEGELTCIGKP